MRVALAVLVALCALAVAACESEPDRSEVRAATPPAEPEPEPAPPGRAPLIGCGRGAEGAPGMPAFHPRRDWAAGPVILYAFRDYARTARRRPEQVARLYERGQGAVKILAGVRAGPDVRVAVAPASRRLTALVYSTPADPYNAVDRLSDGKRAVVFRPCPEDQPRFDDRGTVGGLTHFAGGFLIARAGCIRLLVTAGEARTRRYELPYAAPC